MAASTLSTYQSSLATDPLRSFRFTATFTAAGSDGTFDPRIVDAATGASSSTAGTSNGWIGGFTTISGLAINTQAIQYREGGFNTTVHQIPGMTTFNPITFSRGVIYGSDQAITWMRGMFSAAAGAGLNTGTKGFRVDIAITVNQHPNTNVTTDTPQMVFKVHNAWITGLNYTDLDATNGSILFETMQVVHEGLSVAFTDSTGANVYSSSGTTLPLSSI